MANEALVRALKEIIAVGRTGTPDDAYRGYTQLFASPEFVNSEPADQRQAMKLLVMAKGAPKDPSPAMIEAHQAAANHLTALVARDAEPADHELLGLCHVLLGKPEEGNAVFRAGLTLERERNPSSDLCGRLMKHVAA